MATTRKWLVMAIYCSAESKRSVTACNTFGWTPAVSTSPAALSSSYQLDRWYQGATNCYVYLPDVSQPHTDSADGSHEHWELIFRKSEWFTRGWTLQELIAPASVDFFCKEGELLASKAFLVRHICEVPGIPAKALRGSPLSNFSVTEQLSWAASRETFRQEDKVYSLLGIFGIYLPPIYGEGEENAFKRLKKKIQKSPTKEKQNILDPQTQSCIQ
ncbi:hypothetical protein IFR04_011348 [Cadophora malorum]|uniref:Heterokaryon incompatibility domain-containing protein n=1 Tax=Cadophora malorum TaxID=108018 RepID=A0A8H7TAZ7_9HELO|nr:hypothetical protein IFR04_011348 [Cadophora malorum]